MFVCTYLYMYIWVYTGEVNAKRIRENYLKAILRQDITFFDNVGAGEVATRIQTDTRQYLSHYYYSHSSHNFVRFGSAGYFRESGSCCQLYRRVCYWFRSRLCSFLAVGPLSDSHSSLYRDYWCIYEQVSI